jgi:hypothetical protein
VIIDVLGSFSGNNNFLFHGAHSISLEAASTALALLSTISPIVLSKLLFTKDSKGKPLLF